MLPIKTFVVITALLSGASVSFADGALQPVTREQVHAELQHAQMAGQLNGINEAWDGSNFASTRTADAVHGRPFASTPGLSREEVLADYHRALNSGEIARSRLTDGVGGE
jgi:hypothetical protein